MNVRKGKRCHTDMATAICFSPSNEYYTGSDDQTIYRWDIDGQNLGSVCSLDSCITSIDWYPTHGANSSDIFLVGCTDGSYRIVNKSGREEKKVDAHRGAVISVKWSMDGGAIVSCGEDGQVKAWSKTGMPRAVIAQLANSVYSFSWGGDGDQMVIASGKDLLIKGLQNAARQLRWKAHDGVIMKVDWNSVNNLIISGGEDCRYKIWDSYGRLLYQSSLVDNVITSVSWKPSGDQFVVGCYGSLRLCEHNGFCSARQAIEDGSPFDMCWSTDGTVLGCACGTGSMIVAYAVGRKLQWKSLTVEETDSRTIQIIDSNNGSKEELEYRDRIVEMAMSYDHLVVATSTQCFIYECGNWTSPHSFDLRYSCSLIIPGETSFVLVDNTNGIQIMSYEGRVSSSPRFKGLQTQFLNTKTISLSSDVVAVIDRSDNKTIRFFDVSSGKPLGNGLFHPHNIEEIALSQWKDKERMIAYIDVNRELYISNIGKNKPFKLLSMVDSISWATNSNMLLALSDGKIESFYYPKIIYIDKDLLEKTIETRYDIYLGKSPEIYSFTGNQLTIKNQNGGLISTGVSPYPTILYDLIVTGKWDGAIRLCRFVDSEALWATLAAMAISNNQLDRAEQALACLGEVAKQSYILYIMNLPNDTVKNAELLLYQRKPEEAESMLLQHYPPLTYRAIKMNIRLFMWEHAMEIAKKAGKYVDIVLYYRNRYLKQINMAETIPSYIDEGKKVTVDEDEIKRLKQKIHEEESQKQSSK